MALVVALSIAQFSGSSGEPARPFRLKTTEFKAGRKR